MGILCPSEDNKRYAQSRLTASDTGGWLLFADKRNLWCKNVELLGMTNEPRNEKTGILQTQIRLAVTAKLVRAFVFATRIVQSLYFLNLKFQASRHLLWLYSPVCVETGLKP